MPIEPLLLIATVFTLAGFVKGVIGLGLPTIAMGLLAVIMPPVEAAALLIVPSLATNVWQMLGGPALGRIAGRLWPVMLGVCGGTLAGAGLMTGANARAATIALGLALVAYAWTGLAAIRMRVAAAREWWLGPIIGAATGMLTAATGVFAIPAVPYLQGIGLDKEDLVQALGLSFTVSTLALGAVLAATASLTSVSMGQTLVALAMAVAGMGIGQAVRLRLDPATFRRWFFGGLLLLGLYIAARALLA